MVWIKRILCAIAALLLIFLGFIAFNNPIHIWKMIGLASLVGGLTLGYIAIKQTLPSYNFWITLVAIWLAYMLFTDRTEEPAAVQLATSSEAPQRMSQEISRERPKAQPIQKKVVSKPKKGAVNLAAYPKVSGSATVLHAHVFYIGGRYVRLYGVDAPDNDQLCSDANGSSYNCGEVAASWVRSWIDKNPIDCYLLKIEPNGQDLATCIWGEYDIGAALVAAGWGIANTRETNIYKPYEVKAQSESSGLWQGTFYTPSDWRDIKRHRNDFTIKTRNTSGGGFFGSLFK